MFPDIDLSRTGQRAALKVELDAALTGGAAQAPFVVWASGGSVEMTGLSAASPMPRRLRALPHQVLARWAASTSPRVVMSARASVRLHNHRSGSGQSAREYLDLSWHYDEASRRVETSVFPARSGLLVLSMRPEASSLAWSGVGFHTSPLDAVRTQLMARLRAGWVPVLTLGALRRNLRGLRLPPVRLLLPGSPPHPDDQALNVTVTELALRRGLDAFPVELPLPYVDLELSALSVGHPLPYLYEAEPDEWSGAYVESRRQLEFGSTFLDTDVGRSLLYPSAGVSAPYWAPAALTRSGVRGMQTLTLLASGKLDTPSDPPVPGQLRLNRDELWIQTLSIRAARLHLRLSARDAAVLRRMHTEDFAQTF